ncbi:MAG: hypothetical protein PHX52_03015 [Candidatus Pacebacteria bacterium]|nr:hypothetical protein [Candidatus Paceibacterota bacterium]
MTHKKVFANLDYIKTNGIKIFIDNQNVRIEILNYLLTNFDDGRSKNFYCISCALLPVDKLQEVHSFAKTLNEKIEAKEKCKLINNSLTKIADLINIDLKLNKKK